MSKDTGVHPLVLAAVESLRAEAELELAKLRHRRAWCPVSTTGGQNRAIALGRQIREAERVANGWRTVLAAALADDDDDDDDAVS